MCRIMPLYIHFILLLLISHPLLAFHLPLICFLVNNFSLFAVLSILLFIWISRWLCCKLLLMPVWCLLRLSDALLVAIRSTRVIAITSTSLSLVLVNTLLLLSFSIPMLIFYQLLILIIILLLSFILVVIKVLFKVFIVKCSYSSDSSIISSSVNYIISRQLWVWLRYYSSIPINKCLRGCWCSILKRTTTSSISGWYVKLRHRFLIWFS